MDALIDKYANDDSYKQFLYNNRATILDTSVKSKVHNLRILRNFINEFSVVYYAAKSLEPHIIEIVQARLVATFLAIMYEMALGNLDKTQIDKLKSVNLLKLIFRVSGQAASDEPKYIDDFIEKYFHGKNGLDFYPSIIEYLTSGRLDIEKFKDDLGLYKKEKSGADLLHKFVYSYWGDMEDEEFKAMVIDILKRAEAGNVDLELYPLIYYKMLLFDQNNILPMSLQAVKTQINNGMKKCTIINDVESFERFSIGINCKDPDYVDVQNIVKDIRRKNIEIKKKEELKRIVGLINTDINAFCRELSQYSFESIFHNIDVEELYQAIINSSNTNLVKIRTAFNARYEYIATNSVPLLKKDCKNLGKLRKKLRSYAKTVNNKAIRKYNILQIIKEINRGYYRLINFKRVQGKMQGTKKKGQVTSSTIIWGI